MRISILGTGASEGWPALFCTCYFCRQARELGGKNVRGRTSLLVDDDLKVDIGPDSLAQHQAVGTHLGHLKHLLVTHTHKDHFCPTALQYRGKAHVDWPDGRVPTLNLYGSATTLSMTRDELGDEFDACGLKLHEVAPNETLDLGEKSVLALRANHRPGETCLNYTISEGNQSHLHACDTGWYCDDTWRRLEGVRLTSVTMECTHGPVEDDFNSGHLSIRGLLLMREELDRRGCLAPDVTFVAVHFSHQSGLTHEDYEERLAPHKILTGYDGMVISTPADSLIQLASKIDDC